MKRGACLPIRNITILMHFPRFGFNVTLVYQHESVRNFTRPLDVLHRSWTMLMVGKKTIAVCPSQRHLSLSHKPCNSSHQTRAVSSPAILDVAFASDILTHLVA